MTPNIVFVTYSDFVSFEDQNFTFIDTDDLVKFVFPILFQ